MSDDPFDIPDAPDTSARNRSAGSSGSGGTRRWAWLLAGVALGVAVTLLIPRYVAPYLPAPFRTGQLRVQGPVLGEQQEEDRLLLTVETEEGVMLATFREQVPEISLLIDEGDTVALGVAEYRPFVENPRLIGVWKGSGAVADTAAGRRDTVRPAADTVSDTGAPGPGADTAVPAAADSDQGPGADAGATDTTRP